MRNRQDIVNEDSGALDMETFLPLLQERVYTEDPNNRQFIVSWIQVRVLRTCLCVDAVGHMCVLE